MLNEIPWTIEEMDAHLARHSLVEFVKQAWLIIEPATPLIWNWHLDVICDHVQALLENRLIRNGRVIRNLVINVPPGSMKSTILSVCVPAWIWAQDKDHPTKGPGWRGQFCSGNEGVAIRDSLKCRDILESDWYQQSFKPTWSFTRDQNEKKQYKNSAKGFRRAASAGAKITGDRSDDMFIDDPNDAEGGKADRDAIASWWDNAAYNRLNSMKTGHRCIIQQRLHEEDLTGHILAKDKDDWAFLVIRQEYETPKEKDPDFCPTPLGWSDHRTDEGDLFFPSRFPQEVVNAEKRVLGGSGYAGQHQQRPAPAGGVIFKKGFVKTFNPDYAPTFKRSILTLDTAFKTREENDFSVCLEIGEAELGFYVLGRWKEKASYPDLKLKTKTMADARRPTAVLVEDKASGQSLIQDLERETSLPIVAIKVDTDKVSRAHAVVPTWEAGRIFVPEGADWVDDFLDQLYGFPKLVHDDDVDAFTQGINYLRAAAGPIVIGGDFMKNLQRLR
jgi:predicted phage terminase large subunit-like protein